MIGYGTISNIYFLGPIKPKCFIRSQTASNPNFSKVFDLKGILAAHQTKSGPASESLISGCRVTLDTPFLAQLPQK